MSSAQMVGGRYAIQAEALREGEHPAHDLARGRHELRLWLGGLRPGVWPEQGQRLEELATLRIPGLVPLRDFGRIDDGSHWFAVAALGPEPALWELLRSEPAAAGVRIASALELVDRLAARGLGAPAAALGCAGLQAQVSALDLLEGGAEADALAPELARNMAGCAVASRPLAALMEQWRGLPALAPSLALRALADSGFVAATLPAPAEPSFQGRESERGRIDSALGDLLEAGRGGVLAITGPAGMGKTRLMRETRWRARREGLTLADATGLESGPFYGPPAVLLRQLATFASPAFLWRHGGELARIVPEVAPAASLADTETAPEGQRLRLLETAARLVREVAAARPLVLYLSDLHLASAAAIDLLRPIAVEIARNPSSFSALLLIESRGGDGDALSALLSDLRRAPGFGEIALGPLDAKAAAALLTEMLPHRRPSTREARELGEAGAGIPARVIQAAHAHDAGASRAPAGRARNAGGAALAPDQAATSLLMALAALGRPAPEPLLAAVAGLESARVALDQLLARGLARQGGEAATAFEATDLEAARRELAALPARARASYHARAAEALARMGAPSHEQLAHLEAAGDAAGAASAALNAAHAARDARAWGEAAEYLRRALHAIRDPAARRPLLAEAASLAASAGEPGEAARLFGELEQIEKGRNLETILERARALAAAGELEPALAALKRLDRAARSDLRAKARAATLRSRLLIQRGTLAEAEAEAERAQKLLLRLGGAPDTRLDRAEASSALAAAALASGTLDSALDRQREALDLLGPDAPPERRVSALSLLGGIRFTRGELELALDCWREALGLAERERHGLGTAEIIGNIGAVLFNRGDTEEARRHFARSLELRERVGDTRGAAVALSNLGLVAAVEGRFDEGRELLGQALAAARQLGDRSNLVFTEMTLGWLECESGRRPEGFKRLRRAVRLASDRADQRTEATARALLGEASIKAGRIEAGLLETRAALRAARALGAAEAEGIALRAQGLAAAARGRMGEARRDFELSIAIFERLGNALEARRTEVEQRRAAPGAAEPALAPDSAPPARAADSLQLLTEALAEIGRSTPGSALLRLAAAAGMTEARLVESTGDPSAITLSVAGGSPRFLVFTGDRIGPAAPAPVIGALVHALELAIAEASGREQAFPARAPGAGFGGLIGRTPVMERLFALLARVAENELPVLIEGESGTGKEHVARALHEASPRRAGRYVAIDCAAIPESLIESELFGHRKGAFTGAASDHKGLFEQAQGGTVLLDEVANIPLPIQAKLLRLLQERELRRVGDTAVRPIDARVIAATNRPLVEEVRSGRFREDLYFRLNVIEIALPPLRDRADDIPLLVDDLLQRLGEPRAAIERDALEAMSAYDWPGNVRELENELRRAIVMARGTPIRARDLSPRLSAASRSSRPTRSGAGNLQLREAVTALERELIERALAATGGHRGRTTALLGLSHQGLINKLKKHRLLGRIAGRERP